MAVRFFMAGGRERNQDNPILPITEVPRFFEAPGNEVYLRKEDVIALTDQAIKLVHEIESMLMSLPVDGDFFWKI